jgi:hypothetical protein
MKLNLGSFLICTFVIHQVVYGQYAVAFLAVIIIMVHVKVVAFIAIHIDFSNSYTNKAFFD